MDCSNGQFFYNSNFESIELLPLIRIPLYRPGNFTMYVYIGPFGSRDHVITITVTLAVITSYSIIN